MSLAKMMKKARKDKGVTIKQVAMETRLSASHIHAIETGRKLRPKMQVLYNLACYYHLSIDEVCVAAYRIPMDVFDLVASSTVIMKMLRNTDLLEHPELMHITRKDGV